MAHPMEAWRDKITAGREVSPKLGHKIDMVCDGCGVTFREYPSRRPKPMKFCKMACGIAWQQGQMTQQIDIEPASHPQKPLSGMTLVLDNGKLKQI